MIIILAFLFLTTANAAPRPQDGSLQGFVDAETNCLNKFPSVTREFIENFKITREIPKNPSEDLKCFVACIGKELNLMNNDGELHFEGLKNLTVSITGGHTTHDNAHEIVEKCISVDHDEHCEKAWRYTLCKINELFPYKFAKSFCPGCEDAI